MAAAARGFPGIILTAVIFRTGYVETEQGNNRKDLLSRPESECFLVLVFTCVEYQMDVFYCN